MKQLYAAVNGIWVLPLFLSALVSANLQAQSNRQTVLYVSPSGNDTWPGTEKKPLRTISRAQAVVRSERLKASTDINVVLRSGEYVLDQPIIFTPEDGGTGDYQVTYSAYPGEKPILTGGKRITGWTAYKNGIYKAKVTGFDFRQLYVNNQRAIRARQPNVGDYFRLMGWDLKGQNLILNAAHIQKWPHFEQVELVLQMYWADAYIHPKTVEKVTGGTDLAYVSIQPRQAAILFPRPSPQKQDDAAFHFENSLEFLDQAGEWYLDRENAELYYKPLPGQDIVSLDIIAPVTQTLLVLEGASGKPVRNLSFEGLTFAHANWAIPNTEGVIDLQAGMYNLTAKLDNTQTVRRPPAAIRLVYARNIRFSGNLMQHMGATAIDLEKGTYQCQVTGNAIRSIAGNGILVGAFTAQPDGELQAVYNPISTSESDPVGVNEVCTNDQISNNLIQEVGCDYFGSCAIAAGYPAGLKITHNEIRNAPYTGISLGFGWTSKDNAMHDNLIANNDISRVMNLICDGGGIYVLSKQPGTRIVENYIHDIKRSPWAGAWPIAGIYLDEAAGGTDERPLVLERNSIPVGDKSVSFWNLHREGINLLKNNSIYRIPEVVKKAGIQPAYRQTVYGLLSQ